MIVPAHQALFDLPRDAGIGAIPWTSTGQPGAPAPGGATVSFPFIGPRPPAPAPAPAFAPTAPTSSAPIVRFLGPPVRPVATSAVAAPAGSTSATSPLSFSGGGSSGGFDPSGMMTTTGSMPLPAAKKPVDKSWLLLLLAAGAGLGLGG